MTRLEMKHVRCHAALGALSLPRPPDSYLETGPSSSSSSSSCSPTLFFFSRPPSPSLLPVQFVLDNPCFFCINIWIFQGKHHHELLNTELWMRYYHMLCSMHVGNLNHFTMQYEAILEGDSSTVHVSWLHHLFPREYRHIYQYGNKVIKVLINFR